MHKLPHSAGVHTCHTPDCMNLVPVLLTWHSTLYKRHPLHTIGSYQYCLLWESLARLRTEYQTSAAGLPLKLTLSAMHLRCLCCYFVLEHLAVSVRC
jgi:hypothetical protein